MCHPWYLLLCPLVNSMLTVRQRLIRCFFLWSLFHIVCVFDSVCHSLSAFPSLCFPSLTLTRCLTCLSFFLSHCSPLSLCLKSGIQWLIRCDFPGTVGISELLSGPFNLSTMEGDSRILMGLFYQWAAAPCSGSRQGDREAYRDSKREGCVHEREGERLIILTPPSDSTEEVPCQMIQHRLLSFALLFF